jgi:hypothetical protein
MKSVLVLFFSLFVLNNLQAQKDRDPASYNYEVQFIKTGLEGTELFKVYSYCKKEKDCFEYAKVNALKAILFKGIPGSGLQRPLVSDPGAEDKFRDYFKAFFSEGGKYLNFVAISNDGSIEDDDRLKVGKQLKIGVVVSVQKANLRRELEAAGIIKKLSDGF